MAETKTVLFLSNHFITLYNFRRELVARLLERGHRVVLSMPAMEQNVYFKDLGCEIIETPMSRRGMDPLEDLRLLRQYRRIMRAVDPDVIFSHTIKPNIRELYRISIRKCSKVFFQNTGDRDYFIRHGMVKDNWDMLPGSGVNLEQHALAPMPDDGEIRFLYIGRIMAVKGIDQYLQCAKAIRARHPDTRFYLAGFIEEAALEPVMKEYTEAGIVEYLGFRDDIDDWIRHCHCTVLPSLGGEGVPNVLLESAAAGRACIASNINGSREVIEDGVTGYLYPVGDTEALIDRVERFLALSSAERQAMGLRGHEKAAREFDREKVIARYVEEAEK